MKLGLAQTATVWENPEANMEKCRLMLERARAEGDELVLFPEMTLTGFTMDAVRFGEDFRRSPTVEFFRSEAVKRGIAVGFGMICLGAAGKARNSFIVISKSGDILCRYDKIHPFSLSGEDKYYEGGSEIKSFSLSDFTVSPFVCYDLRFPPVFFAASPSSGLLSCAACWPESRISFWRSLIVARAVENQSYFAGVNMVGDAGGYRYPGGSIVADPMGSIIADAGSRETLLSVDIAQSTVEKFRSRYPFLSDRRPELYEKLYR